MNRGTTFIRSMLWRGYLEDFDLTGERIGPEVQVIDNKGVILWLNVEDIASNMTSREEQGEGRA